MMALRWGLWRQLGHEGEEELGHEGREDLCHEGGVELGHEGGVELVMIALVPL